MKCKICGCELKGRQMKYCSTQCKSEGRKIMRKQYQSDNKKKLADYKKQYNIDNKEQIAEKKKQYSIDNKEKLTDYKKQYYTDNKEQIAEKKKQHRFDNKEKILEKKKQYYKDHRDPNITQSGSEEHRIKMSCTLQGILIDEWDGFVTDKIRPHLIRVRRCIQLNKRFPGSEGHHIMSGVVIFMPKNMHKSISHNFKTGKNMLEINRLAWDWLTQNF